MDKLRVGGPCKMGGSRRYICLEIGESIVKIGNHPDGQYPHGYVWVNRAEVSPIPFIPGDVVEHRDRPGLRELVDDAGKICIRTHGQDGETRFYCYSSVAAEKHGEGYTADLTLILPAQPAKEARDV